MAQTAPALPAGPGQPAAPLGVLEALGMGWRLVMSDFWVLWVVAFLAWLITACSGPGAVVVGPPPAV